MKYRFAPKRDYSDYASGSIFYSLPGHPALPIRLASEIFQRCLAIREANEQTEACVLYDPCCGGAYHLSTLAFLHGESIGQIIGSDVDPEILSVARRNLGLLTWSGLDARLAEISELSERYKKESHRLTLASLKKLREQVSRRSALPWIKTDVFLADAGDQATICNRLGDTKVDIVISDVPYGNQSAWQNLSSSQIVDYGWILLEALLPVLSVEAVVAIISDKRQKISHEHYQRIAHFKVGKRLVTFLQTRRTSPVPRGRN